MTSCPCDDGRPEDCLTHNHPDHFLHMQVADTTYGWWARRRMAWRNMWCWWRWP